MRREKEMTKKRIMVGLLCVGVVFSQAGCWYTNCYRLDATRYLKSRSDMPEQEIRKFIRKGNIEQKRLLQLAKSKSFQVRVMAAQNRHLPSKYLEKMMEDKSWEVVRACSWNPNFTKRMFEKLVHHKDERVRGYLADHKRLPIENLIELSKDKSITVRAHAAKNPRLPEAEMRRLFLEGNPRVKEGLAENHKAPMDILIALSKEESSLIRSKIASNPSLPENDIRRMYSEKKSASLKFGKWNLHRSTKAGLAKNPNTPIDILIELSKDEIGYIRSDALRHPKMEQYRKMEQDK